MIGIEQHRSSLTSQDLTSILVKYVLQLVGVQLTSLLERYVRLGMARRCTWSFLAPSRRTELRMSLHCLPSDFPDCAGVHPQKSELRAHQMAWSAEAQMFINPVSLRDEEFRWTTLSTWP